MRGLETDLVFSGIVNDENTRGGTALGDNAVIVVEDFVDEDKDLERRVNDVAA